MSPAKARSALRAISALGGLAASAAGLHTALTGARSIPGRRLETDPELESEMRFFGPFYAAYGISLLRFATDDAPAPGAIRAPALTLLAAGVARAGGWATSGTPNRTQKSLLAMELTAPAIVLALDARGR